jgi:hypothetical protein
MKQAKFAISALAVLAVVGSTLAFKAHSFVSKRLYVGTTSTFCTLISSVTITTTGTGTKLFYTTAPSGSIPTTSTDCPSRAYTTKPASDNL